MASVEQLATLNSLFKEVYAPNISNLIPDFEMLLKGVKFQGNAGGGATSGNGDYVQPVVLTRDHGISFLGNDTNTTLAAAVVPVRKDARIVAAGKVMKTQLSDIAASRINSKQTFISSVNYLVKSLTESFAAIQESSLWYGDGGYGAFAAATSDLNVSKITFAAEQFAPALWIGGEGMPVDIYASTGSGIAEVITGSVVLSTTISAVDIPNKKLTLASVAGLSDSVRYIIMRKGASTYDSKGLYQILKNTGSLFGIDAAAYPLWMANQYNVNGSLNFAKVADAVSLALGRGLRGPIDLTVHSSVFQHLFPDFLTIKDTAPAATNSKNASRRFDNAADVRSVQHGTDSVTFFVNGVEVRVKSCEYVQPGNGVGIEMGELLRIGSSEIRAGSPSSGEQAFFPLESTAASELRMFSDMALFTSSPCRHLLMYGISV